MTDSRQERCEDSYRDDFSRNSRHRRTDGTVPRNEQQAQQSAQKGGRTLYQHARELFARSSQTESEQDAQAITQGQDGEGTQRFSTVRVPFSQNRNDSVGAKHDRNCNRDPICSD